MYMYVMYLLYCKFGAGDIVTDQGRELMNQVLYALIYMRKQEGCRCNLYNQPSDDTCTFTHYNRTMCGSFIHNHHQWVHLPI